MPTVKQAEANAAVVCQVRWFNMPRAFLITLVNIADYLGEIVHELKRHNDREGDTNGK